MTGGKPRIKGDTAQDVKKRIQALLRKLAIKRDGGCVLRHYPEAGACGGYGPKSGELILQAEHLVTRAKSVSYGDMRNIVCLCSHHHGNWKPRNSRLYWELIERHIGPSRYAWVKRVEADQQAHHFTAHDWRMIELDLTQQLGIPEGYKLP